MNQTIKQKILEVKTDAIIKAVKAWAEDNKIEIPDRELGFLPIYITITLAEME